MACASAWNGCASSGASGSYGPTARITPARTASARERCLRMCLLMKSPRLGPGALFLAARAKVSGALALREGAHRAAAAPAGLALAFVDVQPLAEISRRPVGAEIVAQRRAAGADRKAENGAHGAHQAGGLRARERRGASRGPQARAEQRFARVDVTDAHDQVAVHDQLLQ